MKLYISRMFVLNGKCVQTKNRGLVQGDRQTFVRANLTLKKGAYHFVLQHFSIKCSKTKTNQSNKPIRTRTKYMWPTPNSEKMRACKNDCFWLYQLSYFSLIDKVPRFFFSQSKCAAMQNRYMYLR